ncbi:ATP phosphoribosyltransferase [Wenjunlia vitaminophila]|uniref:ATP phosphoribosyltransferase n=1 Tax=Wenjunlia vitaminophila TaxID=76728 RepID=A0A0T6LWQ9_WENVI|nr:ATP phosphoribosyltransferase [Wenjunlia vitaminophila]KRV50433.1 ATP phosphoribosyltransferase [Wenjunlia vitaminophila]
MLRIALPNKGSLSEPASAMLHEAGYLQRKDARELVLVDPQNNVEFFFLRPRDIAVYVGSGRLDLGITGRDLLLDSGASAEEIMQLGFGRSKFRFATRPGTAKDVSEFGGMTVATSLPGVVAKHLADRGVDAAVVRLDGAVETAVQLGVAEVIADVVETGTTLRNAGLEIISDPILESEAVVVRRIGAERDEPRVTQFLRRLQGVLVARSYVMMDYDIRAEHVDKAIGLTPGLESPTVSPLHNEGWVAVRAMVPRSEAQQIMDDLWEVGARAILVTDIHACRL